MEYNQMEEQENMNVFQKMLGIFYKPTKTLKAIKENNSYGMAMLIGCLLMVISMISTVILGGETIFGELGISEDDYKSIAGIMIVVMAIVGVFAYFIGLLLTSLEVWIISKFFGGEGTFGEYMKYTSYTFIIGGIGTLIGAIIMSITGSVADPMSLAILVKDMDKTSIIYKILSFVSLFGIWQYIVMAKSIKIQEELDNNKEIIAFIIMVIVGLALSIVF